MSESEGCRELKLVSICVVSVEGGKSVPASSFSAGGVSVSAAGTLRDAITAEVGTMAAKVGTAETVAAPVVIA